MQIHDTFHNIFISPLNKAGIRYMVTGSIASIIYGEPRLTHDIDLLVMLTHDDIETLIKIFDENNFYIPPAEVIRIEMNRSSRGHFNIIHNETGYKADIYFTGNDPVQLWGFKNRQKFDLKDNYIWIAPPEYVIVKKLEYWEEGGSDKHLRDIEGMLEVQGSDISEEEVLQHLTSTPLKDKFTGLRNKSV